MVKTNENYNNEILPSNIKSLNLDELATLFDETKDTQPKKESAKKNKEEKIKAIADQLVERLNSELGNINNETTGNEVWIKNQLDKLGELKYFLEKSSKIKNKDKLDAINKIIETIEIIKKLNLSLINEKNLFSNKLKTLINKTKAYFSKRFETKKKVTPELSLVAGTQNNNSGGLPGMKINAAKLGELIDDDESNETPFSELVVNAKYKTPEQKSSANVVEVVTLNENDDKSVQSVVIDTQKLNKVTADNETLSGELTINTEALGATDESLPVDKDDHKANENFEDFSTVGKTPEQVVDNKSELQLLTPEQIEQVRLLQFESRLYNEEKIKCDPIYLLLKESGLNDEEIKKCFISYRVPTNIEETHKENGESNGIQCLPVNTNNLHDFYLLSKNLSEEQKNMRWGNNGNSWQSGALFASNFWPDKNSPDNLLNNNQELYNKVSGLAEKIMQMELIDTYSEKIKNGEIEIKEKNLLYFDPETVVIDTNSPTDYLNDLKNELTKIIDEGELLVEKFKKNELTPDEAADLYAINKNVSVYNSLLNKLEVGLLNKHRSDLAKDKDVNTNKKDKKSLTPEQLFLNTFKLNNIYELFDNEKDMDFYNELTGEEKETILNTFARELRHSVKATGLQKWQEEKQTKLKTIGETNKNLLISFVKKLSKNIGLSFVEEKRRFEIERECINNLDKKVIGENIAIMLNTLKAFKEEDLGSKELINEYITLLNTNSNVFDKQALSTLKSLQNNSDKSIYKAINDRLVKSFAGRGVSISAGAFLAGSLGLSAMPFFLTLAGVTGGVMGGINFAKRRREETLSRRGKESEYKAGQSLKDVINNATLIDYKNLDEIFNNESQINDVEAIMNSNLIVWSENNALKEKNEFIKKLVTIKFEKIKNSTNTSSQEKDNEKNNLFRTATIWLNRIGLKGDKKLATNVAIGAGAGIVIGQLAGYTRELFHSSGTNQVIEQPKPTANVVVEEINQEAKKIFNTTKANLESFVGNRNDFYVAIKETGEAIITRDGHDGVYKITDQGLVYHEDGAPDQLLPKGKDANNVKNWVSLEEEKPEVVEEVKKPEVVEEVKKPEVVEEVKKPEVVEEVKKPEVVEEVNVADKYKNMFETTNAKNPFKVEYEGETIKSITRDSFNGKYYISTDNKTITYEPINGPKQAFDLTSGKDIYDPNNWSETSLINETVVPITPVNTGSNNLFYEQPTSLNTINDVTANEIKPINNFSGVQDFEKINNTFVGEKGVAAFDIKPIDINKTTEIIHQQFGDKATISVDEYNHISINAETSTNNELKEIILSTNNDSESSFVKDIVLYKNLQDSNLFNSKLSDQLLSDVKTFKPAGITDKHLNQLLQTKTSSRTVINDLKEYFNVTSNKHTNIGQEVVANKSTTSDLPLQDNNIQQKSQELIIDNGNKFIVKEELQGSGKITSYKTDTYTAKVYELNGQTKIKLENNKLLEFNSSNKYEGIQFNEKEIQLLSKPNFFSENDYSSKIMTTRPLSLNNIINKKPELIALNRVYSELVLKGKQENLINAFKQSFEEIIKEAKSVYGDKLNITFDNKTGLVWKN